MKSRFKEYISNVWLIEILFVLFAFVYMGTEIYRNYSSGTSIVINAVRATFTPDEYYKEKLQGDLINTTNMIYQNTNCLEKLYYADEETKKEYRKNFTDRVFEEPVYNVNSSIYFIIRNKNTNDIFTNDPSGYFQLSLSGYTDENIISYIQQKNDGNEIMYSYDNISTKSKLVTNELVLYNNDILDKYDEYYYISTDSYKNSLDLYIIGLLGILILIVLLLIIKIMYVIITNKKKTVIKGNFVYTVIYVIIKGFKFKESRKTLVVLIISCIVFFIFYLYMLAIGGTNNNILVNLFRLYPFKGSILLIALPLIGFFSALKISINVSEVNQGLEKINEGDLEYTLPKKGSPEVKELVNNITKIKESYEKAVEDTLKNERMKTELISNVSHDLRTPLTSIINYVNILKSDELTEEEKADYLRIVDKKSKKLKVLIDDLFEMSKINSGKMQIHKQKIDIMSLIHQIVGEYSYIYEDNNIEFKVESPVEEMNMELDGNLISRAIENLVINALKYSLKNTRVYINVEDEGENVSIAVKNIANYEMKFDNDEIFERFARGDKSRNSKVEGSGLGLAITRSIIELHNGIVKITTEGDMFKIYISLPKGI